MYKMLHALHALLETMHMAADCAGLLDTEIHSLLACNSDTVKVLKMVTIQVSAPAVQVKPSGLYCLFQLLSDQVAHDKALL